MGEMRCIILFAKWAKLLFNTLAIAIKQLVLFHDMEEQQDILICIHRTRNEVIELLVNK